MWVPDRSTEATVVDEVDHRSYEVETSDGTYRRNRRDIVLLPEQPIRDESPDRERIDNSLRRSSRSTQPPEQYDPSWT